MEVRVENKPNMDILNLFFVSWTGPVGREEDVKVVKRDSARGACTPS
jgi:hypothetical protein